MGENEIKEIMNGNLLMMKEVTANDELIELQTEYADKFYTALKKRNFSHADAVLLTASRIGTK